MTDRYDECAARSEGCDFTPNGPNGEMQCQYCGRPQESQTLTMDAQLEAMCVSRDATTIMLPAPNGGYVVYVSPREKDVTKGLMSALIDIKLRRGEIGADGDTVVIRPVGIATADSKVYYELKGEAGAILCCGYAPSEAIARQRMANFEQGRKE